jgi:FkbM family methyltransferase
MFKKFIWYLSSRTGPFKGKEKIISWLTRSKNKYIIIKRENINWCLTGHDLNEFYIAFKKNHSPELSIFLSEYIANKSTSVFWDIGANIGAISLPLLKKFKKLKVVMFEPSPKPLSCLIRNIDCNPDLIERAIIMNLALSNFTTIGKFYNSNESFNSGVGGLEKTNNRHGFSINLQTYKGDDLVNNNICPKPDLIKIDVEGFEFEVLQGMQNILTKNRPTILFEHSIYRLSERNHEKNKTLLLLQSFGYKTFKLPNMKRIISDDLEKDHDFIIAEI